MDKYRLAAIASLLAGVGLGCREGIDLIPRAEAQPAQFVGLEIPDMSPGMTAYATTLSVLAASTRYLEHNGDGTGDARADYLPVPDGTVVLAFPRTSGTTVKCCWTADPDDALGDPDTADDANEVDGTDGACSTFLGGQPGFTKLKYSLWSTEAGGYSAGVCNTPTAHDIETSDSLLAYDVYSACAADADCTSTGGNGASALCSSGVGSASQTATEILGGGSRRLRGIYFACRSSDDVVVDFELKR